MQNQFTIQNEKSIYNTNIFSPLAGMKEVTFKINN